MKHYKMCPDKPHRAQLAAMLCDAMANSEVRFGEPLDSGVQRTAREIRKQQPDADWALMVLL